MIRSRWITAQIQNAVNSNKFFVSFKWRAFRNATNAARAKVGLPPGRKVWSGHPMLYGISPRRAALITGTNVQLVSSLAHANQSLVLMPHARSAHQPLNASKSTNSPAAASGRPSNIEKREGYSRGQEYNNGDESPY